jgi:hypothetical protein
VIVEFALRCHGNVAREFALSFLYGNLIVPEHQKIAVVASTAFALLQVAYRYFPFINAEEKGNRTFGLIPQRETCSGESTYELIFSYSAQKQCVFPFIDSLVEIYSLMFGKAIQYLTANDFGIHSCF